jgi:hypothetical protein
MSYLGKQPATQGKDAGPAVKIDDIASNFNGSVTVFDLAVESTAVNPHPNNLAVYLNGVLQHPGDSYAVSGSQIKFNEAPDSGLSFHGHILGSVRTNTPDEQTVTPSTLHDTTKTLISGSFNKGAVSASFAQSSAVTASLRSHVLTSALSGSTTLISGSVASTGSFGSIYTDKNVNASAFVGDGSSLTGIDIPTAAAISGSIVGGVSGSAVSTGSFGRVEGSTLQGTIVTPSQTNITSVGTIGTGTWNGTAIATGYIAAALTSQTSMYNAALKIGRDTHNQFDFATDNVIKVSVNAVDDEFRFAAGGDFHADGDVYAYSGTTASDVSLKKNITDTKYGLDDIMKLRGVDFDWKRDDMGHSVGVLAQEVEVIIPEVVKEYDGMKGRDKVKGVDYNKLVPVLIESIKELKLKLDEQDAIIRDITERELEAK